LDDRLHYGQGDIPADGFYEVLTAGVPKYDSRYDGPIASDLDSGAAGDVILDEVRAESLMTVLNFHDGTYFSSVRRRKRIKHSHANRRR